MPSFATQLLALSAAALLLGGCGVQNCGCGASPDDDFAQHDLAYPGEHTLDNMCACRCGAGALEAWPLDDEDSCEHPGATCTDEDGYPAELVCHG